MVIYDATSNSSFAYESSPKTQLNLHSINRKHPQIPAKRMGLASLIPTSKFSIGNLRTQTRTQIITSLAIPRSQHSRLYSLPNSDSIEARTPSMSEILETSRAQKLDLELQTLGPFFRITAKSLETKNEIGRAEGIIRVWLGGTILHLDSIRLQREALGMEKSIFGIGLFIGGVAVRYGYDCGCRTAELMAINDSDLYHQKLVRFYKRIGFKVVHEVTGSTFGDLPHMLVWGGVGTRMVADIEELMVKWCTRFKSRE